MLGCQHLISAQELNTSLALGWGCAGSAEAQPCPPARIRTWHSDSLALPFILFEQTSSPYNAVSREWRSRDLSRILSSAVFIGLTHSQPQSAPGITQGLALFSKPHMLLPQLDGCFLSHVSLSLSLSLSLPSPSPPSLPHPPLLVLISVNRGAHIQDGAVFYSLGFISFIEAL